MTFHWDHGVDVLGTGVWEFHDFVYEEQWSAERVDGAPDEYQVTYRRDDASLRLFLDEEANVVRTERVRRTDQRNRRS